MDKNKGGSRNSTATNMDRKNSSIAGLAIDPADLEVVIFVGDKVKSLRLEHGYSQQELAKLIKTSTSTISRLEKCKGNPTFFQMVKLSQTLGVRLDDFLPYGRSEVRRWTDSLDPALIEILLNCQNLTFRQQIIEVVRILLTDEKARVAS